MSAIKIHRQVLLLFSVAILLLSTGCAKKTTVVLLADPDGKVGHVTVANDAGSVDITQVSEATVVKGRKAAPTAPEKMSEDQIATDFSMVLSVLPEQPEHFILYFKKQSKQLTDEAKKVIPEILEMIKERKSEDISVIGHADTAGNPQYNLWLSKKRATAVSRLLVKEGVAPVHIKTTSHGEENLLIKTADNVSEPRNRRVEVVVR